MSNLQKFLIISSVEDTASMNIRKNLLNSHEFKFSPLEFQWKDNQIYRLNELEKNFSYHDYFDKCEIYLGLVKKPLIFLDDLKFNDPNFDPDYLIFASRHSSKTSRPALLVHTTGNWDEEANFGGKPKDLSITSALLHKAGYLSLKKTSQFYNLNYFNVDIEVTHHGPTSINKPSIFMELGSNQQEWENEIAGKAVAESIIISILRFLHFIELNDQVVALGFGGTHYGPNFGRLIENANVAFSFICPKYHIQKLTVKLIQQMIENTVENIDYFIIDWKGTNSEDKQHLIPLLEEFNIPIKKTRDFK